MVTDFGSYYHDPIVSNRVGDGGKPMLNSDMPYFRADFLALAAVGKAPVLLCVPLPLYLTNQE